MEQSMYVVEHAEQLIPYQVKYSNRGRSLSIRVGLDLSVNVRAPKYVSPARIAEFVKLRAEWVVQKRAEFALLPRPSGERYHHGEMISFLGQRYQIQVQAAADISSTTIVGNILQLRMVGEATVDAIEKQIKAWYRAEASVVFAERLALAYEQVKHLGIPPVQSWNIRKMKTRWGSCRRSGKITLNKTLIKLPLPIIDYVIIHELCHLKEFNHGKGFYQLMSQALPDWYERREALFKYALG